MFKNFKSKLKKRMERWSKKQLKACKICLWIFILILVVLIFFIDNSTMNTDEILQTVFQRYVIYLCLIFLPINMLFIISSIEYKKEEIEKEKEEEEEEITAFSKVLEVLSTTEYRKVLYSPTGDAELVYCLNLLRNNGVTYHAIIRDNYIHVISKNASGKQIGHRDISATEFWKKYEVIIE